MRSLKVLLPLTLLLVSCEEIIDPSGLPYEDRLVIAGVIRSDQIDHVIQITKTLPLNAPFDTNLAFVRDAQAFVSSDGETYPLEYMGLYGYYRIRNLRAEVGKEYKLDVTWNGLHAYATMRMPEPTSLDSFSFKETVNDYNAHEYAFNLWVNIPAGLGSDIGVYTYQINPNSGDTTFWSRGLALYKGLGKQVLLTPRVSKDSGSTITSLTIVSNTFSSGYLEYAQARDSEMEDPLGTPGPPPHWNIQGDGIGGFFGATRKDYAYKF